MWLTNRNRARLSHARQRLADMDDDPSIERIARELGLSPFHFIRRFEEAAFGVTPHQFRIQQRVERAKTLLASGRSVTDACMEVGFSSVGTFSSLFTRRVGETPSAFRRRMRVVVQLRGSQAALVPGCLTLLAQLPASAFRSFQEARAPRPAHDVVCASR